MGYLEIMWIVDIIILVRFIYIVNISTSLALSIFFTLTTDPDLVVSFDFDSLDGITPQADDGNDLPGLGEGKVTTKYYEFTVNTNVGNYT